MMIPLYYPMAAMESQNKTNMTFLLVCETSIKTFPMDVALVSAHPYAMIYHLTLVMRFM